MPMPEQTPVVPLDQTIKSKLERTLDQQRDRVDRKPSWSNWLPLTDKLDQYSQTVFSEVDMVRYQERI